MTAATPPVARDEFAWHEALLTAHIVEAIFDSQLWAHPVIQQTPALRAQARAISVALGDLYQAIGAAALPS